MIKLIAAFAFVAHFSFNSQADEWDAHDQKALEQTVEVLKNPQQRQQALQGDDKAMKADDHVKELGGEHSEEIYALAAQVFERMARKYNGDVQKMTEVIERAQKDPNSFAASEFSEKELEALRELASKLSPPAPNQ